MKKIVLLMAYMIMAFSFVQAQNKAVVREQIMESADSLSEEQKDAMFSVIEGVMLAGVDSIISEGRFMQALELVDSIQVNWKYLTGRELSPSIYLTKGNILMNLEEWRELVKTTEECLSIHEKTMTDGMAAIICAMQGYAHRGIEEYSEAIRSYENGAYYYNKTGDIGSQGDMLCSMAFCYSKLSKHTMATSFYEKGISKFLEYFGTTRSVLLRSDYIVKDSYKQKVLAVFAVHLYSLAVYEQNHGSRLESKNYLLMSAHCGDTTAKSEYKRIFGYLP